MLRRSTYPRDGHGRFALLLLATVVGSTPALADVRVLEQPGSNFETVQGAVNAASDGDTLLLAGGGYSGFSIDGKGLTLLAAPGVQVDVAGQVVISNLPPASTVRLDGLSLQGLLTSSYEGETALRIEFNQGAVRLHQCVIQGGHGPGTTSGYQYYDGGDGVRVANSLSVAFLNCQLLGGDGGGDITSYIGYGGRAGRGLWSTNSALALYECQVQGGEGGGAGTQGGDGGDGCNISGLGLFSSGSTFVGGDGGAATDFIVLSGGDGGTGLWVGLVTSFPLLDNSYTGGAGGASPIGTPGQPGLPKFWEGGAINDLPGTHRGLTASSSVVADGQDIHLVATGQPGDQVYLSIGRTPNFKFSSQPLGVKLVRFQRYLLWGSATPIGPGGTADIFLSNVDLPPGGWDTLTVQADVRPAGGGKAIGSAVILTRLDDEGGPDCNNNGVNDLFDIGSGLEADCNQDFVPDSCFVVTDCNNNGVDDSIDLECGVSQDLNSNGILD